MFTGSVILLGLAFTRTGGENRLPVWFFIAVQVIGYVFIAVGFFLAMRMRRELREKREKEEKAKRKKKVSPRDPG